MNETERIYTLLKCVTLPLCKGVETKKSWCVWYHIILPYLLCTYQKYYEMQQVKKYELSTSAKKVQRTQYCHMSMYTLQFSLLLSLKHPLTAAGA
jgi:hypothetical protein